MRGDLPEVPGGAGLDQRDLGGEAQSVDVFPRLQVVQPVEDDVEGSNEVDVEGGVLDVAVVRDDAGVGAELEHRLPRHLGKGTGGSGPIVGTPRIVLETNLYARARSGSWGGTHLRLGHAHVSLAEQELAVEIADVDGVEVDHLDIFEAAQHQGLEQLATDAAGADHQDCVFGGKARSGQRGRERRKRTTKNGRGDDISPLEDLASSTSLISGAMATQPRTRRLDVKPRLRYKLFSLGEPGQLKARFLSGQPPTNARKRTIR